MNAQVEAPVINSPADSLLVRPPRLARPVGYVLLFFGVILPLITLGIELFTSMCAEVFFDPIPTVWHTLIVAFVPAANFVIWRQLREAKLGRQTGIGNAITIGLSGFYALLFLPLAPFALFAIPLLGWGLLPLSPLFSFTVALVLRSRLRRVHQMPLSGLWSGLAIAFVILVAVNLPIPLTRYLMARVVEERQGESAPALHWLRVFGHEGTLLRDCYRQNGGGLPGLLDIGLLGRPVATDDARKIYFQVTGRVFNSVPAPGRKWSATERSDFQTERMWDAEVGNDQAGARVAGLSLSESKIDSLVDANAGWSYTEWIMEFSNLSASPREARAQLNLPPKGVVSRLTLWVNGEEREAAFAGRAEVREAYRKVAVVQRRDPVLVTSSGPDRVLMQCFPVPPTGGVMRVRVGITAPLTVPNATQAVMFLPQFTERNFGMSGDIAHRVSVKSDQKFQPAALNFHRVKESKEWQTRLTQADLRRSPGRITFERDANRWFWWSKDAEKQEGFGIEQTLRQSSPLPPKNLVIVIDGSAGMGQALSQVGDAILKLPEGINVQALLVQDGLRELSGAMQPGNRALYAQTAARLRKTDAVGGQDNLPGLIKAYQAAPDAVVLWIHGPQPILLDDVESLDQKLYWTRRQSTPNSPLLYDLSVEPGPNRLVEKISLHRGYEAIPRLGTVREDLERLFATWTGDQPAWQWVRSRHEVGSKSGTESSRHITRLWANEEVLRLQEAGRIKEAVQVAARHQLVTPVSGAVVLENQRQYDEAGLKPVDSNAVPGVPEPTGLLVIGLIMLAGCVIFRNRKKPVHNG